MVRVFAPYFKYFQMCWVGVEREKKELILAMFQKANFLPCRCPTTGVGIKENVLVKNMKIGLRVLIMLVLVTQIFWLFLFPFYRYCVLLIMRLILSLFIFYNNMDDMIPCKIFMFS